MALAAVTALPVGPTSGGKNYAYNNITTSPVTVAPANPQRTTITFHNPGTNNIYIAPATVQAYNTAPAQSPGSNVNLIPSLAALGGCWVVGAGGGYLVLTGENTGAYQAFASAGVTNPLTVTDSNA